MTAATTHSSPPSIIQASTHQAATLAHIPTPEAMLIHMALPPLQEAAMDLRFQAMSASGDFPYFLVVRSETDAAPVSRVRGLEPMHLRLAHALLHERFPINLLLTLDRTQHWQQAIEKLRGEAQVCETPVAVESLPASGVRVVHLLGAGAAFEAGSDTPEMRDWLERLLAKNSPLVMGLTAADLEGQFGTVLRKRMETRLHQPLYWFARNLEEVRALPEWLRRNRQAIFVTLNGSSGITWDEGDAVPELADELSLNQIFEQVIRAFDLEQPEFLTHSLGYLLARVRSTATPLQSEGELEEVVRQIEPEPSAATGNAALEPLREAMRQADYEAAISRSLDLQPDALPASCRREAAILLLMLASRDTDDAERAVSACDIATVCLDTVKVERRGVEEDFLTIQALFRKARLLRRLGEREREIATYAEIQRRYENSNAPFACEATARASVQQAAALIALDDLVAAADVLDRISTRFGRSTDIKVLRQVASAWNHEANALGRHGAYDSQITLCRKIAIRYAESPDEVLQWHAARAMMAEAAVLRQTGQPQAGLRRLAEIANRWAGSPFAVLRLAAAEAMVHHGVLLLGAGRINDACVEFDKVISRFGDEIPAALREQVAWAFVYKADCLAEAGARSAMLLALREVLHLWEKSPENVLKRPLEEARLRLQRVEAGGEADSFPITTPRGPFIRSGLATALQAEFNPQGVPHGLPH